MTANSSPPYRDGLEDEVPDAMTVVVVVVLEAVDVDHQQGEQMLRAKCAIGLRLEAPIEMPAVEEPGQRIRLGEALQGLALLLLHEDRADVAGEELEGLEVGLIEWTTVDSLGDVEHAARLVVDDDRHAHERLGPVGALTGRHDRRARRVADQQRSHRGRDEPGDTDSRLDAHLSPHILGEPDRARDHEVARVVLAQHERRALTAHQLCGDLEDGVEQILCSSLYVVVHVPHSCVRRCRPCMQAGSCLLALWPCGSMLLDQCCNKPPAVSTAGQRRRIPLRSR